MTDRLLLERPRLGQSFLNAMCIAGLVVLVQLGAVTMALLKRPAGERFSLRSPSGGQPAVSPPSSPSVSPGEISVPSSSLPVVVSSSTAQPAVELASIPAEQDVSPLPLPSARIVQAKAPDFSVIKDQVGVIQDPLVSRLVQSGIRDRGEGKLSGAINAFLDAENAQAGHPAILAEIAATYQEMGQLKEAETYWERVRDLGPILGGGYYQAADRVLKGQNPFPVAFAPNQWVKVGTVQAGKEPARADGERVRLTIPILGNIRQNPDGSEVRPQVADLKVKVYCYDLINGRSPGPTTAEITQNFPSKPYDWADGEPEIIEVVYHQPTLSPEDQQKKGSRAYYGYVIDVYYGGVLQDSVESAPELRNLRFPLTEVKEAPPLPKGPDGSLFPR